LEGQQLQTDQVVSHNRWTISGRHCQKSLEYRWNRIRLKVKDGTGEAWSFKAVSEFKQHEDSFDEMGPFTKDKFADDHNPMNL
jgi:hypothetical protein